MNVRDFESFTKDIKAYGFGVFKIFQTNKSGNVLYIKKIDQNLIFVFE